VRGSERLVCAVQLVDAGTEHTVTSHVLISPYYCCVLPLPLLCHSAIANMSLLLLSSLALVLPTPLAANKVSTHDSSSSINTSTTV
jgi:hypothetical protein